MKSEDSRHSSVDSRVSADSPKPAQNSKSRSVLNELNKGSDDDQEVGTNLKKLNNSSDKEESEEEAWEPSISKSKSSKSIEKSLSRDKITSKKTTTGTKSSKPRNSGATKRKRGRKASGSDSDHDQMSFWDVNASLKGSRQCYGHKCIKEAREGSKYCSDNCGINLASLRIMQTLPDRIREWNMTPCEAEKRNRRYGL